MYNRPKTNQERGVQMKTVIISFPFWIGVSGVLVGLVVKVVYLRWLWVSTVKKSVRNFRVFGSIAILIAEVVFFSGPFQYLSRRNGILFKVIGGHFDINVIRTTVN